ncbi:MAG: type 4a pilus biogenesis protein PilO [Minisyncoccales bacterium]
MKKPIIFITITFLIVILLAFFVLLPKYEELDAKDSKLEGRKADLEKINDYFDNLVFQNEKLAEYEQEMAKIDSALPDKPAMPSVFNFIQNTAGENGVSLTSATLSSSRRTTQKAKAGEIETSDIKEDMFSITVAGSYSSFKNFLSVLEKSARLIDVEQLSFSSFGEMMMAAGMPDYSSDTLLFSLQMKVYSY